MSVLLETTLGDLVVDLKVKERPRTCLNFLKLCKIKYYNYCVFHNIQQDCIVQTGDPSGTGRGGDSLFSALYGDQARFFEAERLPPLKHREVGTVSMVSSGGLHASQFLITTGERLDYLDGEHTVFGSVAEGLDVLLKINDAVVDEEKRPYQDIRILHTIILDDPFTDPKDLQIPSRSPSPTPEQLDMVRIAWDEDVAEEEGDEAQEVAKEREAKANAQVLELVGDRPDAEAEAPDNVLFVCKLNAATSDDDLEVIFSRFGTIRCCEVIRDQKSGESLQYAFVEFEDVEACEKAYFKMDNVLIDDRRIHVDFSQSVSKQWKRKDGRIMGPASGDRRYSDRPSSPAPRRPADSRSERRNTGRRSRSPGRGTRSPVRGTRSPVRGTRSPGRGTRSPEKGTRSPGRGTRSPVRGTRSPEKGTRSPGRRRHSRRERSRSGERKRRA